MPRKFRKYFAFFSASFVIFGMGMFAILKFAFFDITEAGHGPKHLNVGSDMDFGGARRIINLLDPRPSPAGDQDAATKPYVDAALAPFIP